MGYRYISSGRTGSDILVVTEKGESEGHGLYKRSHLLCSFSSIIIYKHPGTRQGAESQTQQRLVFCFSENSILILYQKNKKK